MVSMNHIIFSKYWYKVYSVIFVNTVNNSACSDMTSK